MPIRCASQCRTAATVAWIGDRVLAVAHGAGLRAGIFCINPDYSKAMFAKGFDLVTVIADTTLIAGGAALRKQFD